MSKDYTKILLNSGGVSTEPEVNELFEKIGVPAPGDKISYERITQVINGSLATDAPDYVTRDRNRWKSIVGAWRYKLRRNHNIMLKALINEGFQAMTPKDRVNETARQFEFGTRRIATAAEIATKTDRAELGDEDKRILDFVITQGAALSAARRLTARDLQYPELDKGNGTGS